MRKLPVYLICLIWFLSSGTFELQALNSLPADPEKDVIALILNHRSHILAIDSHGNEVQDFSLPLTENHEMRIMAVSHNGNLIAYATRDDDKDVGQFRLFDRLTQTIRLEYTLENQWFSGLRRSRNFNADDTALAVAYDNEKRNGWHILVIDLETGTISHTLAAADTPPTVAKGTSLFIYRFANNTLTFVPVSSFRYPVNQAYAAYNSVDWNLTTNTFSSNCVYTHLSQDTFEPTGEVIEEDLSPYGTSALQVAIPDPSEYRRQVFFQNQDFTLFNPVFVQGGERIVTGGTPSADNPTDHQLLLLERNGTVVERFAIHGAPIMRGTRDGFVYMTDLDIPGWVDELVYVNTREASGGLNPSVIWRSKPDEFYTILWADNRIDEPLSDFIPWANQATITSTKCPVAQG